MSELFSLHVPWQSTRWAEVAQGHYAADIGHSVFPDPGTGVGGRRGQTRLSTYGIGKSATLVS